jgi:hypothetical protein
MMSTKPILNEFEKQVAGDYDSGANCLWIHSAGDHGPIEEALKDMAEGRKDTETGELIRDPVFHSCRFVTWDMAAGPSWVGGTSEADERKRAELKDPMKALTAIRSGAITGNALIIMRDLGELASGNQMNSLVIRRHIIEMCKSNFLSGDDNKPIIIVSDNPAPPEGLRDYVDVINYDFPGFQEMLSEVNFFQKSLQDGATKAGKDPSTVTGTEEIREAIATKLLGTSASEAQRIISYCATRASGYNDKIFPLLAQKKALALQKIDGLTYVPYADIPPIEEIGGFDVLKEFVREASMLYTRHAEEQNLEKPRGLVLIGAPGTGKTFVGQAAAKMMGLDLLMLDVGALFDKYVGGTEQKVRTVLRAVAAMPRCLLMVDEADKMFAGSHENQSSDSGVSSRLTSSWLSWLSNRKMVSGNVVFVLMTMNRITNVPPEMLRTGRVDRIFSTSLPDEEESIEIMKIHCDKRGLPSEKMLPAIQSLVKRATKHFAGADLEEVVVTARRKSYARIIKQWQDNGEKGDIPGGELLHPTQEDLVIAASEVRSLWDTDRASIEEIEKWCAENATPVTGKRIKGAQRGRRAKSVNLESGDAPLN